MRTKRLVLGSLVAVAALAAAGHLHDRGALASTSPQGARAQLLRATEHPAIINPQNFAYVAQPGRETRIKMRSPTTGRVVKVLATFGKDFTNNGVALSDDGKEVYVTLIGSHNLRIEQIATSTGKRTFIANGWEPAVSPNGRLLSYIEGRATIVVRSLRSDAVHKINVASLLGRSEVLDEGDPAAWLGDGSDVVVMVSPMAVAVASQAEPAQAGNHSSASLIVVHVGASGRPLRATRVKLSSTGDLFRISGDQTRPRSLLVATLGRRTLVDRVDLSGSRPLVTQLVSLAHVLPLAFDPAGHYILYLADHHQPALSIAELEPRHLTAAHVLVRDAQLGEISW